MNKNVIRGLAVLALLLAVFSVIAFAAPFARTAVFWIGYGFGIFAVLFQIYVFKVSLGGDAKSKFYGFPIARVGVCYLIAQLIISLIEMALARVMPAWAALIVNVLLAAAAIIGIIAVETARDEIVRQEGTTGKNVGNMRALRSMSATLVGQCEDGETREVLRKLAEALRFSDPVSSEDTLEMEAEMKARMDEIKICVANGDQAAAIKHCRDMMRCLDERNRVCATSKR